MSDTKSSIKVGILKVNLKGTGQNSSYSQDFKFDLNKDYTTYDTTKTGLKIPISNDVKTGDYELREIEAPAGFAKTDKVFKIRINQENRTIELLNESNDIERELFSENSINGTIEFGNPIDIENAHGEFPKTGGVGELPFIFTGLGMLAIAKKGIKKK